jgi:hypothetical protein
MACARRRRSVLSFSSAAELGLGRAVERGASMEAAVGPPHSPLMFEMFINNGKSGQA